MRRRYDYLQHIPKDALDELIAENNNQPFKDLDEVIEFIREGYDREKEIDSCYITYTYQLTTDNFKFEAIGQCYLKDSCICDEQMVDEVLITSFKEERALQLAEQRQKQLDKIFAKEQSDAKWVELFNQIKNSNGTMDDLLVELKKYKFPVEIV